MRFLRLVKQHLYTEPGRRILIWHHGNIDIDGLMQERSNSIVNALELRFSCTNLWIWPLWTHPGLHISLILAVVLSWSHWDVGFVVLVPEHLEGLCRRVRGHSACHLKVLFMKPSSILMFTAELWTVWNWTDWCFLQYEFICFSVAAISLAPHSSTHEKCEFQTQVTD